MATHGNGTEHRAPVDYQRCMIYSDISYLIADSDCSSWPTYKYGNVNHTSTHLHRRANGKRCAREIVELNSRQRQRQHYSFATSPPLRDTSQRFCSLNSRIFIISSIIAHSVNEIQKIHFFLLNNKKSVIFQIIPVNGKDLSLYR